MATAKITSGGRERVPNATEVLSKAFEDDPVLTYMLCSLSHEKRLRYLPKYFHALLTAAAMNHATFDEIDDWASCAVMMPPDCRVDNPWTMIPAGLMAVLWNVGFSGIVRMLSEYIPLADAAKVKAMGKGAKYFYLFFIGTDPSQRRKGLCSALIRHYQEIAARAQHPIWLEATTAYNRKLYATLGFQTVTEMVVGKGKVGMDGILMESGGGVTMWTMIWQPSSVAS